MEREQHRKFENIENNEELVRRRFIISDELYTQLLTVAEERQITPNQLLVNVLKNEVQLLTNSSPEEQRGLVDGYKRLNSEDDGGSGYIRKLFLPNNLNDSLESFAANHQITPGIMIVAAIAITREAGNNLPGKF